MRRPPAQPRKRESRRSCDRSGSRSPRQAARCRRCGHANAAAAAGWDIRGHETAASTSLRASARPSAGGLMSNADYVRELRPLLPAEAFRPNPWAYVPITLNLAIVIAGWIATRHVPHLWWPVLGLVIGNSMSILSFYAHDVAHRSVTTNRYLLYPTELVLWGLIFLPASLWRRVPGAHHAATHGDDEPDRRFLSHELTPVGRVAAATMFPNRTLRYNFACLFYWLAFPWRHAIALLYPGKSKPDFVTAKPRYARTEKIRIGLEFLGI